MLQWFVSFFLITGYNFPLSDFTYADLEVENNGTIWLLLKSNSEVVRITDDGATEVFDTGVFGIPEGLAVSPTGRWAVSYKSPYSILVFNSDDILLEVFSYEGTNINIADIVFSGFSLFGNNLIHDEVVSLPNEEQVWRNCVSSNSRLSAGSNGMILIDGSGGVFLLQGGESANKIAEKGSACFTEDGIFILSEGILTNSTLNLDSIQTDLPYSFLSSSPDGRIVVLWGCICPLVLK